MSVSTINLSHIFEGGESSLWITWRAESLAGWFQSDVANYCDFSSLLESLGGYGEAGGCSGQS